MFGLRNLKKDFPDEVTAVSPFIHYETMAKKGSIMHGVMIRGVDPILRDKVQPYFKVSQNPFSNARTF